MRLQHFQLLRPLQLWLRRLVLLVREVWLELIEGDFAEEIPLVYVLMLLRLGGSVGHLRVIKDVHTQTVLGGRDVVLCWRRTSSQVCWSLSWSLICIALASLYAFAQVLRLEIETASVILFLISIVDLTIEQALLDDLRDIVLGLSPRLVKLLAWSCLKGAVWSQSRVVLLAYRDDGGCM